MKQARKPAPVYYADLRELVFHAAEAFPETRFFPSGDAAMPYVTGRELRRFGTPMLITTHRRYGHLQMRSMKRTVPISVAIPS